ncbi:MAG: hypothetical protein IJ574_01470 [Bacilli bacterium]|nr:hypothetical protein [Bacilli bacterium]
MKKIPLLLIVVLFISGCTVIRSSNIDTLTNEIAIKDIKKSNTYRKGYKYYLPQGLRVKDKTDYNEVINYKSYQLYLYVDVVSYYNKKELVYETSIEPYFTKSLEYNGKKGYIEINLSDNEKYLIEIMYNYAKIEVIVEKDDINEVLTYSLSILNSIKYNDSVISNLLEEDVLSFSEEEFDIFSKSKNESKYLFYLEEYDKYNDKDDELRDNDLIK